MKQFKGWLGEKKTAFRMWLFLNTAIYRRFHNIILASSNGTTQIDHLIVSPYGVFIVETKNIKGWIFGSKENKLWTQVLFNEKYKFQNPLRQTYRQKKVISEFLDIQERYIHTVVYFVSNCSFRTCMPDNVINYGLSSYIKKFREPVFSSDILNELMVTLHNHRSNSNLKTKDHVQSLRERHNSNSICPKCGSKLIFRTARKGININSQFWGCKSYPKCRYTRNIQ